jgi:hypothetical protein
LRACAVLIAALSSIGCVTNEDGVAPEPLSDAANANAAFNQATLAQGRDIFRFDTFGGETYWTDTLQLQAAISSVVTPLVALSVGLKVDVDALPLSIQEGIKNGSIPLNSTATTIALLKLNAVLGVKGTVVNDVLTRVAITCAFCHSTVDNSFAPGIGRRLDGWPNRDLDIGRIVNLSTSSTIDAIRGILLSWGPGRYDPRINQDGIDSRTPATARSRTGMRTWRSRRCTDTARSAIHGSA